MNLRLSAAVLLATLFFSAIAQSQTPPPQTKPYLTVNNTPIAQSVVDAFIAEQKAQGADTETAAFKAAVREEMIRRGALIAEAKKQGLDKRPAYRQQLEMAGQVLLMRDIIADYLKKHPVTEAEIDAAYTETLVKLGNTEYKLRHIQSGSEAASKEIITKLADGKKFDKLAKESTDEATRDKGGDLGWKLLASLPPNIAERLRALKKGDTTPVPLQIGSTWHVFQLEDTRTLTPPKREELQPRLIQGLAQAKAAQYIDSLKSAAQVK